MKDNFTEEIERIKEFRIFSDFDIYFSQFITRISDKKPPELFYSALLLSYTNSEGHVCLDLKTMHTPSMPKDVLERIIGHFSTDQWKEILISCSVVGKPGDFRPLILDNTLLYLHKQWQYETDVAKALNAFSVSSVDITDSEGLSKLLDLYFPQENDEINLHRIAAYIAATKKLCIITGGPGTGKTSTVVNILAFLIELTQNKDLKIALAAPTGKAAARMEEAVKRAKKNLKNSNSIEDIMPSSATTIHRLLGAIPNSHLFRYGPKNLLPVDIAVIDEASMVDLSIMAKFLGALPHDCRLILLGDHNQLASVQAGSVLGDICNQEYLAIFSRPFYKKARNFVKIDMSEHKSLQDEAGLADCIVELKKRYRFKKIIADFSEAVKNGESDTAFSCMNKSVSGVLSWIEMQHGKLLPNSIKEEIIHGWKAYLETENIDNMFTAFDNFRILSVLRSGLFGVETLNKIVENILSETELLTPASQWYAKKPIMITKNNYRLNLYNGDTGIIAPDPASGELKAWFPAQNRGGKDPFRSFSLSRIPAYKTAFAITAHKSQGAEFNSILLMLPESDTQLLTRELIYTAITRAREKISICGKETLFKISVKRRIDRKSGLREKLWGKY